MGSTGNWKRLEHTPISCGNWSRLQEAQAAVPNYQWVPGSRARYLGCTGENCPWFIRKWEQVDEANHDIAFQNILLLWLQLTSASSRLLPCPKLTELISKTWLDFAKACPTANILTQLNAVVRVPFSCCLRRTTLFRPTCPGFERCKQAEIFWFADDDCESILLLRGEIDTSRCWPPTQHFTSYCSTQTFSLHMLRCAVVLLLPLLLQWTRQAVSIEPIGCFWEIWKRSRFNPRQDAVRCCTTLIILESGIGTDYDPKARDITRRTAK